MRAPQPIPSQRGPGSEPVRSYPHPPHLAPFVPFVGFVRTKKRSPPSAPNPVLSEAEGLTSSFRILPGSSPAATTASTACARIFTGRPSAPSGSFGRTQRASAPVTGSGGAEIQ